MNSAINGGTHYLCSMVIRHYVNETILVSGHAAIPRVTVRSMQSS